MPIKIKQSLAYVLAACILFSGIFSSTVQAKMISTEQVQQQYDKAQVLDLLASAEVQEKLLSLGVDVDLVKERVQHLSAEELTQLNMHLDELPAGSGVLGLLVTIFIVLIITDMLGATDVFSFVNKI
jgi:hypothetical protein